MTLAAVDGTNSALGLHIGAGANITIKNATIVGNEIADNLIEVMGENAQLTLEDVTVKGSEQAGIFVGTTSSNSEKLTLKGNINFEGNAWGPIGVQSGASVDATQATITSDTTKVITDGDVEKTIKPIVWVDIVGTELVTDNVKLSKGYTEYKLNNSKDSSVVVESDYNQVIFGTEVNK